MVNLTLQSRSWNFGNADVNELSLTVCGFDLDHGVLTVYLDDSGDNLTLAVPAAYVNEDGDSCGVVGWRLAPDLQVLERMPELRQHVGWRFGRAIVTDGSGRHGMAVDSNAKLYEGSRYKLDDTSYYSVRTDLGVPRRLPTFAILDEEAGGYIAFVTDEPTGERIAQGMNRTLTPDDYVVLRAIRDHFQDRNGELEFEKWIDDLSRIVNAG